MVGCVDKVWKEGGIGFCDRHTEIKRTSINIVQDAIRTFGDNLPSIIYEQLEFRVANRLVSFLERMNPTKGKSPHLSIDEALEKIK